jgi:hypothetical protein
MSAVGSEEILQTGAPAAPGGWEPRQHRLRTSNGTGDGGEADWRVAVLPRPGRIVRRVWMDGEEWVPNRRE